MLRVGFYHSSPPLMEITDTDSTVGEVQNENEVIYVSYSDPVVREREVY